jgi:hypothetical protein
MALHFEVFTEDHGAGGRSVTPKEFADKLKSKVIWPGGLGTNLPLDAPSLTLSFQVHFVDGAMLSIEHEVEHTKITLWE